MVSIGEIAGKQLVTGTPKGQKLDAGFVESFIENAGFRRDVAGDDDFSRAVDALRVAAGENRGLLVTGANGCGKSQFLKAVMRMMVAPRQWISCTDEDHVEWLSWYEELYCKNIILDDLGAERFKYGDVDRVGEFVCRWYDRHDPHRLLFVSTNLNGGEVDARYGGRVFDRLRDLCVILPLKGESKRKEIVAARKEVE